MARGLLVALFGIGVLLGGCGQYTVEPPSAANLTARDKKLLAIAPYENAAVPEEYRRHIVSYDRKERPGTILIDSDARYLYYVLPGGQAIRYGVAVGEEAMAWSGVAKVGRMSEWPPWIPTASEKERLGVPDYVGPGPQIRWARGLCICSRQQGHAVPHPRHQPAGIYRPGDFLGLYPHDQ